MPQHKPWYKWCSKAGRSATTEPPCEVTKPAGSKSGVCHANSPTSQMTRTPRRSRFTELLSEDSASPSSSPLCDILEEAQEKVRTTGSERTETPYIQGGRPAHYASQITEYQGEGEPEAHLIKRKPVSPLLKAGGRSINPLLRSQQNKMKSVLRPDYPGEDSQAFRSTPPQIRRMQIPERDTQSEHSSPSSSLSPARCRVKPTRRPEWLDARREEEGKLRRWPSEDDGSTFSYTNPHGYLNKSSFTKNDELSYLVKHFASFCVLDTRVPGCPISSVSEDLEYVYDIKDRFVLDAQEVAGLSMDISVGLDPQGREITYLMLYGPLVSPETSKASFAMVSAIDVSPYVDYAARLDLESQARTSQGSFSQRARVRSRSMNWSLEMTGSTASQGFLQPAQFCRSCPASIGECSLSPSPWLEVEDVWMKIAREERSKKNGTYSTCRPNASCNPASRPRREQKQPEKSFQSVSFTDAEILSGFIRRLQVLYSRYFILSVNLASVKFYDISFLSPAVYDAGEWITGHMSRNSPETMLDLRCQFARRRRFKTILRWGDPGFKKQVFCTPLIGSEPNNWLCMLVDIDIPISW